MPELESQLDPEIDTETGSRRFQYLTPVADNEDDAFMNFLQYLTL